MLHINFSLNCSFRYSDKEIEEMCLSIEEFNQIPVDGFVFGALKLSLSNGDDEGVKRFEVDIEKCSVLISACRRRPVTFHRAFDLVSDLEESLERCISLGEFLLPLTVPPLQITYRCCF